MFRFGYKSLLVMLLLAAGSMSLAAYYYPPDNQPPGPPPNYNPIDPAYFTGVPDLYNLAPEELDGYFLYFDSVESRWSIMRVIPFGTALYEQFHGSILVQLDQEPQPGVNFWTEGFDLTSDLHRNDRWGWSKWPDSIAPNLYEIWWDFTVECPEPSVALTRTIGFWKTHSGMGPQDDLVTQFLPIWLGTPNGPKSLLVSDAQIAYDILSMALTPRPLDGISKLRAQLLATKLDIASGSDDSVVVEYIIQADAFLADHDPSDWSSLDAETQQLVLFWKDMFDAYNNGYIGPGHDDDGEIVIDCDEELGCPPCVVGISFAGCAFDFNLWGTSYNEIFSADHIYLGSERIPLSMTDGYSDTFEGIDDPYGHPFDCPDAFFAKNSSLTECLEPNYSAFTPVMMPGASYNVFGLITPGDDYGNTYGGARVYEGNGLQFSVNNCPENKPPVFEPPVGYLKPMTICIGDTIYDTIVANDFDPGAFVTITKISGPGDFVSTPGNPPVYGYFSWAPPAAGQYVVVFEAVDNLGASVIDSIVYNITENQLPVSTATDTSVYVCWEMGQICYTIPVTDADEDSLTFTLISGSGSLDPVTGELCFTPDAEGEYYFEVEITDACGSITTSFTITVAINHDPWINPFDTIIALCGVDSICFDVTASDPDPGDSLEINFISGPGIFTQTGNGIGVQCFLPDSVDSARYVFVYNVTDDCWRETFKSATPPIPTDSIVVIVITDNPPVITCPEGVQEVSFCVADSVCIDIPVEPADAIVTVLEPGAVYKDGKLCVYAQETGIYQYTLIAEGECGADTCVVTFDITNDVPPAISCPPSGAVHLCGPDSVSVPLTFAPADAELTITPEASYDGGMLTFFADRPGEYCFEVRATNSCGEDVCNFCITVTFDSPPVVAITDSIVELCSLEEVCVPYTFSDPDDNVVSVSVIGLKDYLDPNETEGEICFMPQSIGYNEFIIKVTDACGNSDYDTATVVIIPNMPPTASLTNTTFRLCEPGTVCMPLTMIDYDGVIDSVVAMPPAVYNPETQEICLEVQSTGLYQLTAFVYDDCGAMAMATAVARVIVNYTPILTVPNDTAVFACDLTEICLDGFSVSDRNGNMADIEFIPDLGTYIDGRYCFTPQEPGEYCFVVRAVDSCGAYDEDTVCVTFELGNDVDISCPVDVIYQQLCGPDSICIDIPVTPVDANIIVVDDAAVYEDGRLCFYAGESGIYNFTLIASGDCGDDTCQVTVDVTIDQVPQVTCPPSDTVHLCGPGMVDLPLEYTPASATLTITPEVDYSDGMIHFNAVEPGEYCFTATVSNQCGTDSCSFCITVIFDSPPVVVATDSSVALCNQDTICVPVTYSDPDNNIVSVVVEPEGFILDEGEVCFLPDGPGTYEFYIAVTDSCGSTAVDTGTVTVSFNQGPSVSVLDTTVFLCEPADICLPVEFSDPDGVIDSVHVSPPWSYNPDLQIVCLSVSSPGEYYVMVTVYDDCGASASDSGKAIVGLNTGPSVTLPNDDAMFLCEASEVCFPVDIADPDNNIQNITVLPEGTEIVDGNICFTPATGGTYEFIVTVSDSCGLSDADTIQITIDLNQPPMVDIGDTTLFSCEPVEVCLPVVMSDPDGEILNWEISGPAVYDSITQTVCLTVTESGEYDISMTVYDSCGVSVSDTGRISVTINSAPVATAPPDTSVFACEPTEICLDGFAFDDIDGNITSIEITPDPGTWVGEQYCFTPQEEGEYCFVVRATDECGAWDEDTVCVTYQVGTDVAISCPDGIQPVSLCNPDTVCIDIPVEPVGAGVIVVEPGAVYENGKLCFYAEGEGMYTYTLIATGDCGADTCQVTFEVSLTAGPQVSCPADTAIHICDPDSISIPIGIIGGTTQVIVSPEASYDNGVITFYAAESGDYCFEVIASNECGSDTCSFCVTVTVDSPPWVTIADTTLFLCDLVKICLPYEYDDPDGNVVSVTVVNKNYTTTEGLVCFSPAKPGMEEIILMVEDSCGHMDLDTATVNIILNQKPTVAVGDTSVFLCEPTELCVPVVVSDPDGSIDSIVAVEPAYYDAANGRVCIYARESGNHKAIVKVYDDCGAMSVDTGIITVRYNYDPMVTVPADTSLMLCAPAEICIDGFSVIDIDDNLESIQFIPDIGAYANGSYCFTPQEEGQYCIVMQATDTCGAVDADTVCITVTWGEQLSLDCPEGIQEASLCEPDTVCIDVPVTPVDAEVVVLEAGGVYRNGQLCFFADQSGRYVYTVIATGECNADTCVVTTDVSVGELPVITCPEPSAEHLCGPDSISVPLTYTPITAQLTITPEASYADGKLTFYAGVEGEYCFEVIAAGDCGSDTCNFCVTVTFDDPPIVSMNDSTVALCNMSDEVCIPVTYSDPDNNIETVEISPSGYEIVDGFLCFSPPEGAPYQFIVTVTDSCGNQAADTATIDVYFNNGPSVQVGDSSLFLCETGDICLPVTMSDPDGTIDSIWVSPPAYYDAANHRVCQSIDADGSYDIIVTVFDNCGASATDTGTATVATNTGPTVEFGQYPNPLELCDLSQVCLPIVVYDAEDNIVNISGSTTCGGQITFGENHETICWLPNTFGLCTITVIVTDACGESDTAQAEIELIELPMPDAPCPGDTTVLACEVDEQICIDLGVIRPTSHIRVLPSYYSYVPDLKQLCYFADHDRIDTITVIDSTECGMDSCKFVLTTIMNHPPIVAAQAPEEVEFCHSVEICFDYTVSDPDNNIKTIKLEGTCPGAVLDIPNSRVCLNVTTELNCALSLIGVDSCGAADTVIIPIVATPNQPPLIHLPDIETVVRCEDDNSDIVIADICVTDPDYDEVTMIKDSGLGDFVYDEVSDCGVLTFSPPNNDSAQYCFRFRATDLCDTVYSTFCLNVLPAPVCSTCVEVAIEDPGCVNSGQVAYIHITADATNDIAAYDILIGYDATAMNFLRADIGSAIDGWEYFTYRYVDGGDCDAPCPSGLIRLVAIADVNNGAAHPPVEQLHPSGRIATITFRVSSDLNLGGQSIPIEFVWVDCGDNGFSDPSGQYLYIDNIIYSPEGNIIWDETNDAVYPESARPPHTGAPDECLIGDKEQPIRCLSLTNGELCITHPDSVDARGDLNLNGVPYEIADAVVYTNYFISGLSAFNINVAGQIAASDINADGLTLSIADLVYLVRVIIGDAEPYPKAIVGDNTVYGSCKLAGEEAMVSVNSAHDIGAALLIFNCEGVLPGDPILAEGLNNMEIKSGFMNGSLRVLIYSFEAGGKINAGASDLVRIAVPEGGSIELVEMEAADYYGHALNAKIGNTVLPNMMGLTQNHPNPFNPVTTFELALPTASDYTVTVYNITGQVVRRWTGYAEAGYVTFEWNGCDDGGQSVASGIYFYRAQAAGSEAIKKMVLLK